MKITGSVSAAFFGLEQDAEQIEDLLGRADAAREHDDRVRHPHERLEPLLHVRQDHELVADRVRRFGRDDRRLREPQVAPRANALLGVPDGRAFHRALHRAGAAARADVETLEPERVADDLRVVVLLALDGVAAPADDEPRLLVRAHHARVAQDVEHGVRDPLRAREVEARVVQHVVVRVEQVAQHGEQVLADAADHLRADERDVGRVLELERDAAFVLHDGDAEVLVAAQDLPDVVVGRAGVQHGQRALAPELVEAAAARVAQLVAPRPARGSRGCPPGLSTRPLRGHGFGAAYGRISIGVDSRVMSQMSTMSELLTAMQPSVQSVS